MMNNPAPWGVKLADAAPVETRQPQVSAKMSDLFQVLGTLDKNLTELEGRLGKVMLREPDGVPTPSVNPPNDLCPLAGELSVAIDEVATLNARINHLMRRLEL